MVEVKTQKMTVFVIGVAELLKLPCNSGKVFGLCQCVGKFLCFVRKTSASELIHGAQKALFDCVLGKVLAKIPKRLCELTAGIAFCFGKLHVGGKLSLLHKLAYTLRNVSPRNDLSRFNIPCAVSAGKVNTVLRIPRRHISTLSLETEAAVIFGFEELRNRIKRFSFHVFCGYSHAAVVCITAETEYMVYICLLK